MKKHNLINLYTISAIKNMCNPDKTFQFENQLNGKGRKARKKLKAKRKLIKKSKLRKKK